MMSIHQEDEPDSDGCEIEMSRARKQLDTRLEGMVEFAEMTEGKIPEDIHKKMIGLLRVALEVKSQPREVEKIKWWVRKIDDTMQDILNQIDLDGIKMIDQTETTNNS